MKNLFQTSTRYVLPCVVVAVAFSSGIAIGQGSSTTQATMTEFANSLSQAELHALSPKDAQYASGPKKLANSYSKVVRDPEAVRIVLGSIIGKQKRSQRDADSAPQATQVASEALTDMQPIIIAQNQRIIELLEQLNKKK
jgi:hypothetical protein